MPSAPTPQPGNSADEHLSRLRIPEAEDLWCRSFFRNVRDAIHPAKLPPLEVTSKPVAVRDIWGDFRHGKQAGLSSILIHASVVVLLFTAGSNKTIRTAIHKGIVLVAPTDLAAYLPNLKGGGGGGGGHSLLPASKGQAPPFAPRQLVPPSALINNSHPILPVEPTLIGRADIHLPTVDLPVWGDPFARIGPPSDGPGSNGGIGPGSHGGIGPNIGPGIGPGPGIGCCNGVFPPGNGVSRPVPIYKVEPEYSEEARKAHFQGTVLLQIVIDEHGTPTNFKIIRTLGLGLDEKAVEAVAKWRFRPGMKNGKPVAVIATVEVNFRLL
jgi:protein TonB